jgi:hypothetical protein
MLADENPRSGQQGYYLAASGLIAWKELYAAFASALARLGHIKDPAVHAASRKDVEDMAKGLDCPVGLVAYQLAGT